VWHFAPIFSAGQKPSASGKNFTTQNQPMRETPDGQDYNLATERLLGRNAVIFSGFNNMVPGQAISHLGPPFNQRPDIGHPNHDAPLVWRLHSRTTKSPKSTPARAASTTVQIHSACT
jgi:hypothetical protein